MCADFTLSQIGGASGSPIRPQPGVESPSGVGVAASLFSGVVDSLSQGGLTAGQQASLEKDRKYSVVGSRFANQQLQIAQAVDRGDLTSQEARMRMRANYAATIADNPGLIDEITSLHKGLVGTSGLGLVAKEGTQQEQAFNNALKEATINGWVTADMGQEQAAEQTRAYMQFNRSQEMINAAQNELALQRAQLGYKTDQIQHTTAQISQRSASLSLTQKQAEIQSQEALGMMGQAYMPKFRSDMQRILEQQKKGVITDKEAVDLIDGQWATLQATVAQVGTEAGSSYIQNIIAPMQFMYGATRKRATGELDTALYEQQTEKAIAMQTANMSGDPELVRALATSKMFPNSDVANINAINTVVGRWLTKNGKEGGSVANLTDPDDEANTTNYLNIVKSNLRGIGEEGSLIGGAEAEKEVRNNINNILKGVTAYSSSVESPEDYNQLVEFFASPDFGQYASSYGMSFNKQTASAANQVLMQQYEQEVIPLIEQAWAESQTVVSSYPTGGPMGSFDQSEDTSSLIKPVWSGTGVSFVARDQSNPRVNAKVQDLNKRVSPVVNRLIRMGAHLQGTMEYKKVYEENYARLFGEGNGEQD